MSGAERNAGRVLAVLGRVERAVAVTAFAALVAILFADVLSRELTGSGLVWARQLAVYSNLLLTMFGIGVASADGAHLRPRFADRWLPRAWDAGLDRTAEALMSAFCLAFAAVAVAAVLETHALAERSPLPAWQVWPFQAVIPAVFCAAALRHALHAAFPRLRPVDPGAGAAGAAPGQGGTP